MRRASEMDWIGDIIQVGIRGVGSARDQDVRDALAYGAKIVTARTVHAAGIQESVVDLVPQDLPCFITIDCDGLDPSVMPAVGAPVPGGLTFLQVAGIVQAVARKAPVAGEGRQWHLGSDCCPHHHEPDRGDRAQTPSELRRQRANAGPAARRAG
jgi:agmatinase